MDNATIQQITELIEPVLAESGYELVEVQLRNEQNGLVLRVIIYKNTGIFLDDCSFVSREIGDLLEIEDLIKRKYHLEVSSPGLDRPLKNSRDFARNIGGKVEVRFIADGELCCKTGLIVRVDEKEVELSVDGIVEQILLELIVKAKLVIEF